ncbi:MAG TPA: YdcF family protein [Blastocatellia bacterium]
MTQSLINELAGKIWDYHHLNHTLEKSDVILVLGSNDLRVAEYSAELYLQAWAPLIVFSGNAGLLTRERFDRPEAELFAEIALRKGVPESAILIEAESTNSGENVVFSRRLLESRGIDPESLILVQKPYMERRAYATFMNFWPGRRVLAASPPIPFSEYPTEDLPRDLVINIMVGDLQRIKIYPERGFQIAQEIPDDVWQAFEKLVELGYDKHLI